MCMARQNSTVISINTYPLEVALTTHCTGSTRALWKEKCNVKLVGSTILSGYVLKMKITLLKLYNYDLQGRIDVVGALEISPWAVFGTTCGGCFSGWSLSSLSIWGISVDYKGLLTCGGCWFFLFRYNLCIFFAGVDGGAANITDQEMSEPFSTVVVSPSDNSGSAIVISARRDL